MPSNVNGPGGRPAPTTTNTSGTTTVRNDSPATGPANPAPAANTGWVPGGNARALDLRPPSDGFVSGPARGATVSAAIDPTAAATKAAVDNFNARISTALGHDAMAMARGTAPWRQGDTLTPAQNDALKSATEQFFKELPAGALSPQLASGLSDRLRSSGLSNRDVSATKLGDLGGVGRDVAKELAGRLRDDSPAAFYGLAATAAAAIGYVGYKQGSEKLESLGIKPQISTGFFDDQLKLKVKGNWGPEFSNFSATIGATGNLDLGNGHRVTGDVNVNTRTGFESAGVGYRYEQPNLSLSADARFDNRGLANISAGGTWTPRDDLRLSANVAHDFRTSTTTGSAEAAWRVRDNVDFALSGSHDSRGDSRIGAGVRIRF